MSLVSKIQEINNSIQKNATAIQNGKAPTETVDLSGLLSEAGNVANGVATTIFNNAQEAMNVIFSQPAVKQLTEETTKEMADTAQRFINSDPADVGKTAQAFMESFVNSDVVPKGAVEKIANYAQSNAVDFIDSVKHAVDGTHGNALELHEYKIADSAVEVMDPFDHLVVAPLVEGEKFSDKLTTQAADSAVDTMLSSENDLYQDIGALMAGTRNSIQAAIYIPHVGYNGLRDQLNDNFNSLLLAKNQSKGIDRTGKHQGDNYVSIGDSVMSGWGLDDYKARGTYIVANENVEGSTPVLVGNGLGGKTTQLHMPGVRTNEVLYMLDDNYSDWALDAGMYNDLSNGTYSKEELDSKKELYRESIRNADVITLDVGFNDIWAGWAAPVYEIFNDFKDPNVSLDAQLAKTPEYAAHLVDGFVGGGLAGISYAINYKRITDEIYKLNPDATLVITGGYNPEDKWSVEDLIPGVEIDDRLIETACQVYWDVRDIPKKVIALTYPGEAVYVDLAGTEVQMGHVQVGGISQDQYGIDPHATANGNIEMSTRILKGLGQNPVTTKSFDTRDSSRQYMSDYMKRVINSSGDTVEAVQRVAKEAQNPSLTTMSTGSKYDGLGQVANQSAKIAQGVKASAKKFFDSYKK